jgi:hypothetical protein
LFDGRWQDAEAYINEASEMGSNSHDGGAEGVYGAQMFFGPIDLYLGMLCSQMNRLEEAEQLFDKADSLCESSTPNIWQAHVKYRHAQVLKRHNFNGDTSIFSALVDEAHSLAQTMGMVNLLAKN